MPRCAGVQKVSRPMDMCQEMSQYKPITVDVTASAELHTYQGTAAVSAAATARGGADVIEIPCAMFGLPEKQLAQHLAAQRRTKQIRHDYAKSLAGRKFTLRNSPWQLLRRRIASATCVSALPGRRVLTPTCDTFPHMSGLPNSRVA